MSKAKTEELEELSGPDEVVLDRAERYVALGFGTDAAFDLAEARGLDGFRLYWGDVAKMLKGGATHEQVLAIFA
jgi:hypothetical protein